MTSTDDPSWDAEVERLAGPGLAPELASYLGRLPAGYRALTTPAEALEDRAVIARLQSVEPSPLPGETRPTGPLMGSRHVLAVRPSGEPTCSFRLRRYGEQGIELTATLPLLESFGLVVVESVPMRLRPARDGEPEIHIDDIGLRAEAPYGPEAQRFVPEIHGGRLVDAIEASAHGRTDVDSLNRLVTAAGLDWRQVMLLRAYLRYWRQSGVDLTWDQMADPVVAWPDVARALVGYFGARFDPAAPLQSAPGASSPAALGASSPAGPGSGRGESARGLVLAELELVTSLAEDRCLRSVLALMDATLRTNYFLAPEVGPDSRSEAATGDRPVVLKLDSRLVPDLPAPRPRVEAFLHGPTVEGVHLRAGLIARGGLRWSERPTDLRTEIVDLAFAQVKKNAIIVPTGAKGGFVCRGRGRPGPDQIRAAYEIFVAGLLDVTDNLVADRTVTPPGVVTVDGADPYLVVAADKGTATFSDLANSISKGRHFWLGDAFASGGSSGYDHKAMGITARGAWVAVRRHFREVAVDVATDPLTVVGVGDMSGDVFGNGMLRSRAIRLLAAFDHRHVFIDPDPDPDASYEERSRLARLERSSWADYRAGLISAGGGVWARDTKLIPLAPAARRALGIEEDELSPPQVISAILCAPVDLLWFGGIGTFIKAPGESDVDVADHANDGVRVTSERVRARVIAEGANLGITQQGRIRYSRRGGRINADFIDNAAGVATSDREVNLKILLSLAIERGRLEPDRRDSYLHEAEDQVAFDVLRQVDHSVAALNRAAAASNRDLDAYEALIDDLEVAGWFGRQVEVLPDREEFAVRRQAGAGLIRPELAAVLTFAKTALVAAIEDAGWCGHPVLLSSVVPYFPDGIRADFADLVPEHRLYRQLVATNVAGEVVDQMGIVWAHDLAAETGRSLSDVAAAFWVAHQVTGAGALWAELEALAAEPTGPLSAPAEAALHESIASAVTRLVRRYLGQPGPFDPGSATERERARVALGESVPARRADRLKWSELKVPEATAERFLAAERAVDRTRAVALAEQAGQGPEQAGTASAAAAELGRVAGLDRLVDSIATVIGAVPGPGRLRLWQARALLDDIEQWRLRTTAAILAASPGGDAAGAVGRWAARHAELLRQAEMLAPPRAGGSADPLAAATLALRRLGRADP